MTQARQLGRLGAFALLLLQLTWHIGLLPATRHRVLVALLYCLPLLPSIALYLMRRPNSQYWAGVAALLYFCHGVAEIWTTPEARPLAWAETALALWIIIVGNWDALRARRSRPAPEPPPV